MNDSAQRNELNFWQGNVSTMRRDMDMQLQFNQQLSDENKGLRNDVDNLKAHLQMKDREQILMTKQIRALHEDNERIVAMYKQVQQTPSKGAKKDEEVNEAPIYVSEYA
jgi:regulator of replication initiation timing